jgi:hypothetical protein
MPTLLRSSRVVVCLLLGMLAVSLAFSQTTAATSPQTSAAGTTPAPSQPAPSTDSGGGPPPPDNGCGQAAQTLTATEVKTLLGSAASDDEISAYIAAKARRSFSAQDVADFANTKSSSPRGATLMRSLATGPDVYIGWSVLPPKVLRDNYGHYVVNKYFGLDVAVANRSSASTSAASGGSNTPTSVIISALEFCPPTNTVKDISADPTLVRGSLQKGELTGKRSDISNSIQALGTILAPVAPFFKNAAHRANYSTGVSLLDPIKSAFDLIWPDTIATYLTNWDKDQVFKQGFVVAAGQSERGRVFIPIEYIYPRPGKRPDKNSTDYAGWEQRQINWKIASSGKYDPEAVKKVIGSVVVLGQQATIGGRVVSASQ